MNAVILGKHPYFLVFKWFEIIRESIMYVVVYSNPE